MTVVDTSALVAITLGEDDAERLLAILRSTVIRASAASLVEAEIVIEARMGPDGTRDLDLLVGGTVDVVVPLDEDHARTAVAAWRRFGRGRHPARLNMLDCMSYATARLANEPLLFKGNDFAQTDIAAAI